MGKVCDLLGRGCRAIFLPFLLFLHSSLFPYVSLAPATLPLVYVSLLRCIPFAARLAVLSAHVNVDASHECALSLVASSYGCTQVLPPSCFWLLVSFSCLEPRGGRLRPHRNRHEARLDSHTPVDFSSPRHPAIFSWFALFFPDAFPFFVPVCSLG
ncbi:hypothetical protein K438DRAFT_2045894, partial [Mycena galopus ATCC 62051]